MSKSRQVPYNWEGADGIEDQLRELIIAQASIIYVFGPVGSEARDAFLGVSGIAPDPEEMSDEDKSRIDIKRHGIYRLVRHAYDYAYQLDGYRDLSSEDIYEIECGLLNGYPQTDMHGEPTGLSKLNDKSFKRVLETCSARWRWSNEGEGLTVRELSLLANLGEPTVRSSISKEGLRLEAQFSDDQEDARAELSADDASQWLSRRRGFIPNRDGKSPELRSVLVSKTLESGEIDFPAALKRILEIMETSIDKLNIEAKLPEDWLENLIAGHPVDINLPALKRMAKSLSTGIPEFASRAVRHLLGLELE
jgi:hypothetical protein